eukprot:tig00020996_g16924.t1
MLEERCFRAAAAEAKQGSGRDWSREQNTTAQFARRLLPQASACRFPDVWPVAAGIGLGVHACGRSGAASSSPSPSPSRSRSRAAGRLGDHAFGRSGRASASLSPSADAERSQADLLPPLLAERGRRGAERPGFILLPGPG